MESKTIDAKNWEQLAWYETILTKHVSDRTVSRVLSVDFISAVPEGTNYSSLIYRATINVVLRSGEKAKLTLIVKKAHESKGKLQVMEAFSTFKSEISIYKNVLEKYNQLMNESQDPNDKLWCNLIGYQEDTIVFEDLKMKNFKMADRRLLLDKNHALLVLNALGRFHAYGYALIQRGILRKDDFSSYYLEKDSPTVTNFIVGGLTQLCRVMEADWSGEWKEISKRLYKQKDVIMKKLNKLFIKDKDAWITVAHGDCWTCNMMFKYCPYDEKLPVGVKFLDYQATHMNSFAFDIMYFLYVSVQTDVRTTYWTELINIYYNTLKSTLKHYNLEDSAPTLEYVNAELIRLDYYGMVMNLIYMAGTSGDVKDIFDMEKLADNCDSVDALNPEIFKVESYKNNIQKEIKKWLKNGLF